MCEYVSVWVSVCVGLCGCVCVSVCVGVCVYSKCPHRHIFATNPYPSTPFTGVVSLVRPLDHEVKRTHKLTVGAMSGDKVDLTRVIVNVRDRNDNKLVPPTKPTTQLHDLLFNFTHISII